MCDRISEEALLLHTQNPHHELLLYVLIDQNNAVLNKSLWDQFLERFGGIEDEHSTIITKAYNNYYYALNRAIGTARVSVCDDIDSY